MRTFYGVFKDEDQVEFHKIEFDHYLFRTSPGKTFIKEGRFD
jgi:hypothetical protein